MNRQKDSEVNLQLQKIHLELDLAKRDIDQNNISPLNMKEILEECMGKI
jgi:hypothetical protein